jgi:predicted nucleic acid-binding protein
MAENGRVLVDSSVWIDFFRGTHDAVKTLGAIIKDGRVVICGQILQEVLQGSRDANAFEKIERKMSLWEYEAEQAVDFRLAARLFAQLRWADITVPPSDCLIAAVAKRCGIPIYASDPHFGKIPQVRLFEEISTNKSL